MSEATEPQPYSIRCPYCGCDHQSWFWDEIEELIRGCRERAERTKLGLAEDYDGHTRPTTEWWRAEALAQQVELGYGSD